MVREQIRSVSRILFLGAQSPGAEQKSLERGLTLPLEGRRDKTHILHVGYSVNSVQRRCKWISS